MDTATATRGNVIVVEMDDGPLERAVVAEMVKLDARATVYYYKARPSLYDEHIQSKWTESPIIVKARQAAIIFMTMVTDSATDARLLMDFGMADPAADSVTGKIYSGNNAFLYFSPALLAETQTLIDESVQREKAQCYWKDVKKYAVSREKWFAPIPPTLGESTIAVVKRRSALVAHYFLSILDIVFELADSAAESIPIEAGAIDTQKTFYNHLNDVLWPLLDVQSALLLRDAKERNRPDVTLVMLTRYGNGAAFFDFSATILRKEFHSIRLIRPLRHEVRQLTPLQIVHDEKTGYVDQMLGELHKALRETTEHERMAVESGVFGLL